MIDVFTQITKKLGYGVKVFPVEEQKIIKYLQKGHIDARPKAMEWVAAFGLIVSLAWVYYEAVKLVFRLAMMFGRRD